MIYRDYISWWLRPSFLQPWGKASHTLFAGPFAGEFGWELMNWQAFLRWLAPRYSKVIVCCRDGNQALYADFAHEFVIHGIQGTSECNTVRDIRNPEEMQRILSLVTPGADHLLPVGWQPNSRKIFKPLGNKIAEKGYDVVFHPRGRGFGSFRNWSEDKWNALIESLQSEGLRLACIGLRSATLEVQGSFADMRNIPLDESLDLMASSRLVIGPSSGPMHMASLCRTPHLVWTDTKGYARGRTNRVKYEHWWNPFSTPVLVLDHQGFDPSVEAVLQGIRKMLA